ncbi:MAG: hypothetical protein KF764_34220 [Labilithrix sp.]|nr:hypothetical protein [Labilithrix sp.]MBX3219656.1 hypothetical protein [Labilithrix sp.]
MTTNRSVLVAGAALSFATVGALLGACASDESANLEPENTEVVVPANDAGAGEAGDAEPVPCTADDCEYFPEACGADVLCPGGLFDAADPTKGMDWRTRIQVIRGRSATDVWLAGTVGASAHFDGTSWTPSDLGTTESQRVLWLPGGSEIVFGSLDRLYSRGLDVDAGGGDAGVSAGGWAVHPSQRAPTGYGRDVTGAWAAPGSDSLWLATATDLWRLRLTGSTFEARPGIPGSVCSAIPCRRMRSIHGASAGTLWAVGEVGAAVRITGADGDTPEASPSNTMTWTGLSGVWAASDAEAWAVGGSGTIIHNTGAQLAWDVVTDVPTNENLNAVWGTSPTDVWVVGNAGVVLHFDGTSWSRVKIAGLGVRRPDLYTVWSSGPGNVWIGGQGVVLALGGKS